MLRRYRIELLIFAVFLTLTLLLTYPLVVQMGSAVKDPGDPLLNAWTISWNVEQVVTGNLAGFFDANIFYPHPKTLAYSEFLIPQSIVAAPVLLASGNPILAYNVTFILAIATTAFTTFLLGRLLTNDPYAGFVAGLAFAFNPYLFDHLSHLQVLTAAGIPLAFFFLHKYFKSGSLRHLLLFSLSFVMQALANGYYAVFLTYFAGLFILDRAVHMRWLFKARFWGHMALHAVIAIGLLAPFYYQYVWLRVNAGFVRDNVYAGTMWSFASTSRWNNLYGELTSELIGAEWHLFPGLAVLGLAGLGVLAALHRQGPAETLGSVNSASPAARFAWPIYRVAGWTIVACVFVVAVISATGGIDFTLWLVPISATRIMRPIWIMAAALLVRVGLVAAVGDRVRTGSLALREPQRIYVWMLALAFIVTLGPEGLNRLVYDNAPGFAAVRGLGRIHVVSIFCLAALSAFGIQKLLSRLGARGKMVAARAAYDAFVKKWTTLCPAVARSLEEAGLELLTFYTFPEAMWKALRTTNTLENLNREFRRRTKTQASFGTEDAALTVLFGLVAFGQIQVRRIDGSQALPSFLATKWQHVA